MASGLLVDKVSIENEFEQARNGDGDGDGEEDEEPLIHVGLKLTSNDLWAWEKAGFTVYINKISKGQSLEEA